MKLTKRTVLIMFAVVFGGIIAVRIVLRFLPSTTETSSEQQALVVRAEQIVRGQVVDQVKISGTVRPINEVEIFPKVQGRITALYFNVGDTVHAGDVLAVIEHNEISLQEKSARASLAMAKTNESAAKNEFERAKDLVQDRAMAKAELEAIEQKYDVAKAQRMAAQAQADIAAQQLRNASITSLISGTITKRTAAIGASVSPQAPIFTVQDLSKLKVVTSVDAPTLLRLKKGDAATLTVDDLALTVSGKLISLAPSLDAQSRRAEIEIELLDHDGKLVPNMFIDGALVLSKLDNVILVPNKALITSTPEPSVFRIVDGKIEVVNAKLGKQDALHAHVIEGLKEGDMIAVSGLDRLHQGSLVTIDGAK